MGIPGEIKGARSGKAHCVTSKLTLVEIDALAVRIDAAADNDAVENQRIVPRRDWRIDDRAIRDIKGPWVAGARRRLGIGDKVEAVAAGHDMDRCGQHA